MHECFVLNAVQEISSEGCKKGTRFLIPLIDKLQEQSLHLHFKNIYMYEEEVVRGKGKKLGCEMRMT